MMYRKMVRYGNDIHIKTQEHTNTYMHTLYK